MENLPVRQTEDVFDQQRRLAAYLDSQGKKATEIAEFVGVTSKSIHRWRKEEGYLALRKEWQDMDLERIGGLVTKYRHMVLDGAQDAWNELMAALKAEDSDGNPNWFVRIRAAETMLKHAEGATGLNIEGASGGRAAAAAAVIVIARDHPDVIIPKGDVIEHADFADVADDREGDIKEDL